MLLLERSNLIESHWSNQWLTNFSYYSYPLVEAALKSVGAVTKPQVTLLCVGSYDNIPTYCKVPR